MGPLTEASKDLSRAMTLEMTLVASDVAVCLRRFLIWQTDRATLGSSTRASGEAQRLSSGMPATT